MKTIMARIACLFNGHWYEWVRNFYGDEVNMRGGKRSRWQCQHCGKYKDRNWLWEPPQIVKEEDDVLP